jgi:hypothetical protein
LRLPTRLIVAVEREPLDRRLWIIDEQRIRVRGESS